MSLSALPPEVLSVIVDHLDTKSVYNLYKTRLVSLQGLMTKFDFSNDTFATAKVLESNFFRDTARNLRVLNMACAKDLDCPTLLGAIRYLPNLTELDVSYTKITMPDFLRIVNMAPNLTSISINFSFGEDYWKKLKRAEVLEYQEAFKNFKNVKLVLTPSVTHETFRMKLATFMLRKASLDKLQFELDGPNIDCGETDDEDREIKELSELILHQLRSTSYNDLLLCDLMDFSEYDITDFQENYDADNQHLFVSPDLNQFVPDNYHDTAILINYNTLSMQEYNAITFGIENIFVWKKLRIMFDRSFWWKMWIMLKDYTVLSSETPYINYFKQISDITRYKWHNVHHFLSPDALKRNKIFEIYFGSAFKLLVNVKL